MCNIVSKATFNKSLARHGTRREQGHLKVSYSFWQISSRESVALLRVWAWLWVVWELDISVLEALKILQLTSKVLLTLHRIYQEKKGEVRWTAWPEARKAGVSDVFLAKEDGFGDSNWRHQRVMIHGTVGFLCTLLLYNYEPAIRDLRLVLISQEFIKKNAPKQRKFCKDNRYTVTL